MATVDSATSSRVEDPVRCPECGSTLTQVKAGTGWCPDCEWGLGNLGPVGRRHLLIRRGRRRAFAVDRRMYTEVTAVRPREPRASPVAVALAALSFGLVALDVALVVGGVLLVLHGVVLLKVFGVLAVLVAVELRPRFGRVPADAERLTRADAPALFDLLDRAAAVVGARPVELVVLDDEVNAWSAILGWRRRRVLGLGIPLWGALDDAGRLALLGHELAHFVNGDPTRALLAQPAVTTFGRLAEMTEPDPGGPTCGLHSVGTALFTVSGFLGRFLVLTPLFHLFRLVDERIQSLASADSRRAEYLADSLAVELGGVAGAVLLARTLVHERSVVAALRRASHRSKDSSEWQAETAAVLGELTSRERLAEQVSIRLETSPFATHPPSGLRLRAVRSWAGEQPAPGADLDVSGADAELHARCDRLARSLSRS